MGSRYYWPTLKPDDKRWSVECQPCQSAKVTRHVKRPLAELPCPTERFSRVHIDIVGPLSSDNTKPRYLLTMVDAHTRWLEARSMSDISAETIANIFYFDWVSRFGVPLFLITDKGRQFTEEIMKLLNKNFVFTTILLF